MVCVGCSGAITRILKKFDGVQEVTCDGVGSGSISTVTITGTGIEAQKDAMFEKLQKWGESATKQVSME